MACGAPGNRVAFGRGLALVHGFTLGNGFNFGSRFGVGNRLGVGNGFGVGDRLGVGNRFRVGNGLVRLDKLALDKLHIILGVIVSICGKGRQQVVLSLTRCLAHMERLVVAGDRKTTF